MKRKKFRRLCLRFVARAFSAPHDLYHVKGLVDKCADSAKLVLARLNRHWEKYSPQDDPNIRFMWSVRLHWGDNEPLVDPGLTHGMVLLKKQSKGYTVGEHSMVAALPNKFLSLAMRYGVVILASASDDGGKVEVSPGKPTNAKLTSNDETHKDGIASWVWKIPNKDRPTHCFLPLDCKGRRGRSGLLLTHKSPPWRQTENANKAAKKNMFAVAVFGATVAHEMLRDVLLWVLDKLPMIPIIVAITGEPR